jgi:hypothetical protein
MTERNRHSCCDPDADGIDEQHHELPIEAYRQVRCHPLLNAGTDYAEKRRRDV